MEEFFGSEEALRCFEKTETIDEKIRQLWALSTVQASRFLVQEDGCETAAFLILFLRVQFAKIYFVDQQASSFRNY